MGKFIDLTNQQFNRLIVIKRASDYITPKGRKIVQWLCQCNCQGENSLKVIRGNDLKSGKTQSCGCLLKEKLKEIHINNKKYNIYDLSGEYGIGYATNEEEFYFNLEDYNKIKNHCWNRNDGGYIVTTLDDGTILWMHRLVMNCPDDMEIDHIYHDTWDNRKEFLRIVTTSQNGMNRILNSNNTSGTKGVSWHNGINKWCAFIQVNNKQIHLGSFDNFEDAVKERKGAEEIYFGEYALKGEMFIGI